jgi:hypothetical protein
MLSVGLSDPFGKGPSAVSKLDRHGIYSDIVRSVNVISFPWSQSDHIKRLPLYQVPIKVYFLMKIPVIVISQFICAPKVLDY